jgi:ABC-type branched-subunit amino acid transport system substrate-binding protein
MKALNRRKLITASAVLAIVGLAATAIPAQAREVGVTSTSIKLGMTLPMTGTASLGYNKIPGAAKAYFDYLNANGGIYGRKVTLVVKDDRYVPTEAVAKTNELILKDKVMALLAPLGTANVKAVASSLNPGRRGIPVLFVNTGFSGFADKKKYPTTYTVLPSYVMEAKIMGQYIKEKFAGKRIGILYQDDDFGTDALAGFKTAGVTFASKVAYASGSQADPVTVGKWITTFVPAKLDVVILFGVSSATAAMLRAAGQANYSPQWILGSVGGDSVTIRAAGAKIESLAGAIGFSPVPATTDMKDEYVEFFSGIYAKAVPNSPFDLNVLLGMNTAFMAAQALKAAGPNPTRKSLINAINTRGATFANSALVPAAYSRTSQVGLTGYWIGSYSSTGNLEPLGGSYVAYTTDSGSGPVVKSTYKRPDMPAKGLPN